MAYPSPPVYGQPAGPPHSPYGAPASPQPYMTENYQQPGQYYQQYQQPSPYQQPAQYFPTQLQTQQNLHPSAAHYPVAPGAPDVLPYASPASPALPPRPPPSPALPLPPNPQDDLRIKMTAAGVSEAQIAQVLGAQPSPSYAPAQVTPNPYPPTLTPQNSHPAPAQLIQTMHNMSLTEKPQPAPTDPLMDESWPFNMPSNQPIVLQQSEADDTTRNFTPFGADRTRPMYTSVFEAKANRERYDVNVCRHAGRDPEKTEFIASAAYNQDHCYVYNADDQEWEKAVPIEKTQAYCMESDTGILPQGRFAYWYKVFNDKRATGMIATYYCREIPASVPVNKILKYKPNDQDKLIMQVDRPGLVKDNAVVKIQPGYVKNLKQLDECVFAAAFIDARYGYDAAWHLFYDKNWTWDQIEAAEDLRFLPIDVLCKSVPNFQQGSPEFEAEKKARRKEQQKIAVNGGKLLMNLGKLGYQIGVANGAIQPGSF